MYGDGVNLCAHILYLLYTVCTIGYGCVLLLLCYAYNIDVCLLIRYYDVAYTHAICVSAYFVCVLYHYVYTYVHASAVVGYVYTYIYIYIIICGILVHIYIYIMSIYVAYIYIYI